MAAPLDVLSKAREFAQELSSVLNSTVTKGVHVSAALDPGGLVLAGVGVSQKGGGPRAFRLNRPVGLPSEMTPPPPLWMTVSYQLEPEDEDEYLQVRSSVVALTGDEDGAHELMHFDYERD